MHCKRWKYSQWLVSGMAFGLWVKLGKVTKDSVGIGNYKKLFVIDCADSLGFSFEI